MSTIFTDNVCPGQVWRNLVTGNRYLVLRPHRRWPDTAYYTVKALDGGGFGDRQYTFRADPVYHFMGMDLIQQPNARFWVYVGTGFVKITLRPGQTLRHHISWRHDEGWSAEGHEWRHEGDRVDCDWMSEGRDCDGSLAQYASHECPMDKLRARRPSLEAGRDIPGLPGWQEKSASQRDAEAERAGY